MTITTPGPIDSLRPPLIYVMNDIHDKVGEVMRGGGSSRSYGYMPRIVFLGRKEYDTIKTSGLYMITTADRRVTDTDDGLLPAEYVMGLEIILVNRNEFVMVV